MVRSGPPIIPSFASILSRGLLIDLRLPVSSRRCDRAAIQFDTQQQTLTDPVCSETRRHLVLLEPDARIRGSEEVDRRPPCQSARQDRKRA
jgi:hypothetical protein